MTARRNEVLRPLERLRQRFRKLPTPRRILHERLLQRGEVRFFFLGDMLREVGVQDALFTTDVLKHRCINNVLELCILITLLLQLARTSRSLLDTMASFYGNAHHLPSGQLVCSPYHRVYCVECRYDFSNWTDNPSETVEEREDEGYTQKPQEAPSLPSGTLHNQPA